MLRIKYYFFVYLALLFSACAAQHRSVNHKFKKPKNIILMIGDGMGLSQITAGMYMNGNRLNLEQFKTIGLHKNYPKDIDLITDSAAGATAFACGCKTYNAAVGVKADTTPCKTILEHAEEHQLATGMVTTCAIQHATPGSFIGHVKHREMYEDIALGFLKTDIDLFIGGGKKYFERRKNDSRNLLDELRSKGYAISSLAENELDSYQFTKQNTAFFTAEEHPLPVEQGRDYLPTAVEKALSFLNHRSKKGFFLMVEGSQIDWGGHAGKPEYITSEMIDFDKAIGKVLDFAKADGETLVIVTADHETGGFCIRTGSTFGNIVGGFGDKWDEKNATYHHTGTMIPVFAFGKGSEHFSGIYENTAIFDKMKMLFGF